MVIIQFLDMEIYASETKTDTSQGTLRSTTSFEA